MQAEGKLGKVVVAPEVLLTMIRQTVLSTPGVAHFYATWPESIGKLLGFTSEEGLAIQVVDTSLTVDVHIVVYPDVQMIELGRALQENVRRSIQELVGLQVKAVNVHIEDVEMEAGPDTQRPNPQGA